MSIEEKIIEINKLLRDQRYPNEMSVSTGIVLPILEKLGWDVFNPRFVLPEYSIGGGRVDYALFNSRGRAVIFVEVKMIGQIDGAERQLFEYAFHQGVPFLILTDGKEWNFYLPLQQGNYLDRKLNKFDLLENDPNVIVQKLKKYLEFHRVDQGFALSDAETDFKEISQSREAQIYLPIAWNSLLERHDDVIINLLIDKVADLSGFRPDRESCIQFLDNIGNFNIQHINQPTVQNPRRNRIIRDHRQIRTNGIWFMFNGQRTTANSAREVMIELLKRIAETDRRFLDNFYNSFPNGQRKLISRNKLDLYPGRPDLCEDESLEFLPGWWIGLNYNKQTIASKLEDAIRIAGKRRGDEINFDLNI